MWCDRPTGGLPAVRNFSLMAAVLLEYPDLLDELWRVGMHSKQQPKQKPTRSRKAYSSPRLVAYGDLQQLTKAKPGRAAEGHGITNRTPCWIAEVLYGTDDPRTHLLRSWLTQVYVGTLAGSIVVRMYMAYGHQIARLARRSSRLRGILRLLFDAALTRALRDYRLLATHSF